MWKKTGFGFALAILCLLPRVAGSVTLADLWAGTARFEWDSDHPNIGSSFAMHCLSTVWHNGTLYTYYIKNHGADHASVGLATSTDGLNFTDRGTVLDIGGAWQWNWTAQSRQLHHQTGRSDGDGWSANVAQDAAGFLSYGPYATNLPAGNNTASFVLTIDDNRGTNDVCRIEAYDATSGKILASQFIARNQFATNNTYQTFTLNYTQAAGHSMEFRTYWLDKAYIKQQAIGVSQGWSPWWDARFASFAGVWKEGSTWYMAYEGAGYGSSFPGDIGLATSSDGIHWIKNASNERLLIHQTVGFESGNIGTPSLYKENGTWYLYYHGYDGTDCHIGAATGTSLTNLTRCAENPIIKSGASGQWDAGGVGKRSIRKEGSYYYMIFEGSTDHPFDTAKWSTGIARSTNLLNWTRFSGNPIIPRTTGGFGYDAPEFIQISDTNLFIYYRSPIGPTDRSRLVAK